MNLRLTSSSEKMESWFCWIHLVILFRNTCSSSSPPRYTIHQSNVTFDEAAKTCSPGVLTTLATELEVADILKVVSESKHWTEFTFWVGLRKVKNECVVPTLPLRGFKWTEDGSEESQVDRWTEEPQHTCTTVRCAVLKGEWDGLKVTRWGLIPVSCRNSNQFICKLRDRETGGRPADPGPPKPAAPEQPKPATPEPSAVPEPPKHVTPAKSEPRPTTQKPEPTKLEPGLPSLGPKPETETGPELRGPDPGLDSCWRPPIPKARSITVVNNSMIQVECWSMDPVELRCLGRPAMWRLPDDSPANFTAVCRPCESGFRKDVSGSCVDVDECSSGSTSCRFSCLNTVGSFRCFCSDDGEHHDEDSPACTETTTTTTMATGGVLMPVLVAAAVLAAVLVLVVIVVTVKCCLTRRSRKRAEKKAEKMAMRSDDGGDSANETAA